jgi:hypothetical protein
MGGRFFKGDFCLHLDQAVLLQRNRIKNKVHLMGRSAAGHLPAGGSAEIYRTVTFVPTFTREYRSITCSLTMRKQPLEAAVPMVQGWIVP